MTAISLDDMPVRSSPVVGLPTMNDESPTLNGESEFACSGCGEKLEYSGRGRKPKWCGDCRPKATRKTTSIPSGNNDKLAAMATDVLCQANNVTGMVLMLMQFNGTAHKLIERETPFRMQAYEALKTDPALCKSILKGGAKSGKIMLISAYAMLAISIAPTAIEEFKEKRVASKDSTETSEAGNE